LGSFDVIIGMDWLSRYNAVIAYVEKLVCIPFGNEILTIRGEGSNERNESRLNIISIDDLFDQLQGSSVYSKIDLRSGKENVVADALSRKEHEPLRVQALVMTISLNLPKQILNAQTEARKPKNIKNEDVGGML
nr:putative reverse transcriptase domain-containing protein [Tanacetum cinerariifolium]